MRRGRKKRVIILLLSIFITSVLNVRAQKLSISTNALNYVNLITINAELGYSLDRRWSIFASGKYNPFSFNNGNRANHSIGNMSATKSNTKSSTEAIIKDDFLNKQATLSIGAKYWPWHVYSGFFYSAKLQYSIYNQGGILSPLTEEGTAYGLGVNIGYSLLVSKYLNLEFGLGIWMGGSSFTQYSCPTCGKIVAQGKKSFILPNDALLSLVFTF